MSQQTLSELGASDIMIHEGYVGHAYRDPIGVLTIGTGFTWRSTSFREWWAKNRPGQQFGPGSLMTRAESIDALRYTSDEEYGASVASYFGKEVPQHVFDASTSMVFNCGTGALRWTWASFAKSGDYSASADRLRVTATTADGKTLPGLVSRRKDEARLLEFGIYVSGAAANTKPHIPTAEDEAMRDGMLTRGERGASVLDMQRRLARHNFYTGKQDGLFGFGTEAAVLAFQRSAGLTADGVAGPKTLSALAAKFN